MLPWEGVQAVAGVPHPYIQTAQSRLAGRGLEIDDGKSRGKSSGRNRKEQEGRERGRFDGNTL